MSRAVIKVEKIYKDFVLPHTRPNTIKSSFLSLLRGSEVTKESQHALRDVSFEVKEGEFFGIVGRNGSGKSTLLKILAGIYQPTKGTASVTGKLVPFIELGVGFNPDLTGRENVYLNGALLGFGTKDIEAMYDDIVDFAELKDFMDQKLKNYSSGMQVRLAFSMAVRADADILLIDEVLAVGDAAFQRKCLNYFRKLKKDKKTVVFVSHDMDSVRQFCDRAVFIEKNKVVKIGTADEIAELYTKMFAREAQASATGGVQPEFNEQRWGSMTARFEGLHMSDKVLTEKVEHLEFGGELVFKQEIEKPVLGFKILDGTGKPITGTNSMLLHADTLTHSSGSRATFLWRVPNIFSNGTYEISLAVKDNEDALDVWNGALKFEVVKSMKTPYFVTPGLGLKIDKVTEK